MRLLALPRHTSRCMIAPRVLLSNPQLAQIAATLLQGRPRRLASPAWRGGAHPGRVPAIGTVCRRLARLPYGSEALPGTRPDKGRLCGTAHGVGWFDDAAFMYHVPHL